jgi:hypothetical protein
VLRDVPGDDELYTDVDELIDDHLEPGDMVWCVKPFSIGPDDNRRACKIETHTIEEVYLERGRQSEIIGYRIIE